MSWFDALQLALRLLTVITPIVGQIHVTGNDPVDPALLSDADKQALADLHATVNS